MELGRQTCMYRYMDESVCMSVYRYVGRYAYTCMYYNVTYARYHSNLIINKTTYRLNKKSKFTKKC